MIENVTIGKIRNESRSSNPPLGYGFGGHGEQSAESLVG